MKVTYEFKKEDIEEIVRRYFQNELNYEQSEVICLSKDANFKVEIDDLQFDELR